MLYWDEVRKAPKLSMFWMSWFKEWMHSSMVL